jgi:hypothetical protein
MTRVIINKKTGLIILGVFVVLSIYLVNALWNPSGNIQPLNKLPTFKIRDVEGTTFDLSTRSAKPIIIHFMVITCGGSYSTVNDNQLRELAKLHLSIGDKVEIVTVVVTTCATTDLIEFKHYYNVTWTFGNDYDDKKLDVLESFKKFNMTDGTIIIGTSQNVFQEMVQEEVELATLREKLRL